MVDIIPLTPLIFFLVNFPIPSYSFTICVHYNTGASTVTSKSVWFSTKIESIATFHAKFCTLTVFLGFGIPL